MGLETVAIIPDLDPANPLAGDNQSEGDDHFRNLKAAVLAFSFKHACRVATTADITLSGEQTLDGVLTSTDRVLVKDQAAGAENGIYVSAAGAWTRAEDFDEDADVLGGSVVPVSEGTVGGNKLFVLTTDDPITVGSTALTFSVVTPSAASDTVAGVVELATTAETTTGTDATRAVTPDGLKDGYQGSTAVTVLGTIATGVWEGTTVAVANGGTGVTTSTGTGAVVRATSPALVTPALGTPASGNLANCTGYPETGGGGAHKITVHTAGTTHVHDADTNFFQYWVQGGGGGGGGSDNSWEGGGGGAGGYSWGFAADNGNITITVGAAGTAGSRPGASNGGAGGSSSANDGTLNASGAGGSGGTAGSGSQGGGGGGGAGSGGSVNINGADGEGNVTGYVLRRAGANSMLGTGGKNLGTSGNDSISPTGYGAGGGGANAANADAHAGGAGIVVILEYK